MSTGNCIDIGFIPEWDSDPTLLVLGTRHSLAQFSTRISAHGTSKADSVHLTRLPHVRVHGDVSWTLVRTTARRARGLTLVDGCSGTTFDWLLDDEAMKEVAEKLASLAESHGPGHQYLTTFATEDAVVIVSKGEYTSAIFGM